METAQHPPFSPSLWPPFFFFFFFLIFPSWPQDIEMPGSSLVPIQGNWRWVHWGRIDRSHSHRDCYLCVCVTVLDKKTDVQSIATALSSIAWSSNMFGLCIYPKALKTDVQINTCTHTHTHVRSCTVHSSQR